MRTCVTLGGEMFMSGFGWIWANYSTTCSFSSTNRNSWTIFKNV